MFSENEKQPGVRLRGTTRVPPSFGKENKAFSARQLPLKTNFYFIGRWKKKIGIWFIGQVSLTLSTYIYRENRKVMEKKFYHEK